MLVNFTSPFGQSSNQNFRGGDRRLPHVTIAPIRDALAPVVGDRPNAVASSVNATKEQWADGNLPDGFFSTPCLGSVENLGRNTFVDPDYWNVASTSLLRPHAIPIATPRPPQTRAACF